jgi:predicted ATPase
VAVLLWLARQNLKPLNAVFFDKTLSDFCSYRVLSDLLVASSFPVCVRSDFYNFVLRPFCNALTTQHNVH